LAGCRMNPQWIHHLSKTQLGVFPPLEIWLLYCVFGDHLLVASWRMTLHWNLVFPLQSVWLWGTLCWWVFRSTPLPFC